MCLFASVGLASTFKIYRLSPDEIDFNFGVQIETKVIKYSAHWLKYILAFYSNMLFENVTIT